LQRDLSNVGGVNYNDQYAPALFIYDPQILLTLPDAMRDSPITWQEVAP